MMLFGGGEERLDMPLRVSERDCGNLTSLLMVFAADALTMGPLPSTAPPAQDNPFHWQSNYISNIEEFDLLNPLDWNMDENLFAWP